MRCDVGAAAEACDAGAAATQERRRRSDAGAATGRPRGSGSRADVLDTEDTFDGWEQDLRSQHSVILKPGSGSKKTSFQCELCEKWLPSWSQVPEHCRGAQHQKNLKKAALEPESESETKFAPASKPICDDD